MYKIPKQTRDNLINLIANAVHPNASYAQVAQVLNELQEAEEIKEDKKKQMDELCKENTVFIK